LKPSSALSWLGHSGALAVLIAAPLLGDGRYLPTVLISVLLLFATGALFDFMLGYLNIVNFGIAGFFCAGAYAAGLSALYLGTSPWLGLVMGGVGGLALGLLTGVLTLPLRGVYVGLTTLFVMEFLRYTLASARDVTRGMSGLQVDTFTPLFGVEFRRSQPLNYYYLLLILVAVIYACLKALVSSRIGLIFRAIRDDELGASVLGFRIVRYKLLNFAVATSFMGVLGAFYAYYIGILVPSAEDFGIPRTVEILTVAYVGGRGTLWGALLGALALIGVQEFFRDLEEWRIVVYGSFLILVLLVFPRGLAGIVGSIATPLRRRFRQVPKEVDIATGTR
jgi:branched-chain amino acid transport system permease protein